MCERARGRGGKKSSFEDLGGAPLRDAQGEVVTRQGVGDVRSHGVEKRKTLAV